MSLYYFKTNMHQNPNVNYASSTGYLCLHLKVKVFFAQIEWPKKNMSFISDLFSNNLRVFVGQSG